MDSAFNKGKKQMRLVAQGSGNVSSNLGVISMQLDRANLTSELVLGLDFLQTWGTNAPTSHDMRFAFTKIELTSSKGTHFSCGWPAFYDLMRATESKSTPLYAYGAGGGAAASLSGICDLHFELDGSPMDVLTFLDTSELSSLNLKLTVAPDAQNAFIGGTGTVGVTAVNVTVEAKEYPDMKGAMPFGVATQFCIDMLENTGVAAVSNKEVPLKTGNKTRFLLIQTLDTSGARPVFTDAVVDKFNLKVQGHEYFGNSPGKTVRKINEAVRGMNNVGCYLLDLGDDPAAYADFEGLVSAKLEFSTLAGAPASWKATCTQVYIEGLKALGY